eukprot:13453573-Alexandrium_andersonii.AAC.1
MPVLLGPQQQPSVGTEAQAPIVLLQQPPTEGSAADCPAEEPLAAAAPEDRPGGEFGVFLDGQA